MTTRSCNNIFKPKQLPSDMIAPPKHALLIVIIDSTTELKCLTSASKHLEWRKAMVEEFFTYMHNGT